MTVDWKNIYPAYVAGCVRPKKFVRIPQPLPWAETYPENLHMTAEWLCREGKGDEVRFAPEDVLNAVRGGWYRVEFEPGKFMHICEPQKLLQFRGQYDSSHAQLKEAITLDLLAFGKLVDNSRQLLWSAWRCMGYDGQLVDPNNSVRFDSEGALNPPDQIYREYIPYPEWPRHWSNQCSRCCSPLPKALKMWINLQHSKLKDI